MIWRDRHGDPPPSDPRPWAATSPASSGAAAASSVFTSRARNRPADAVVGVCFLNTQMLVYYRAVSRCLSVFTLLAYVCAQGVPIHYASVLTGLRGIEPGLQDGTAENTLFNFPTAICGIPTVAVGPCSDCTLVRDPAVIPPPLPPPRTPRFPLSRKPLNPFRPRLAGIVQPKGCLYVSVHRGILPCWYCSECCGVTPVC